MKIIKQGNYNSIKRFECGECGCIFEADNNEYHFLPFKEMKFFCECPTCKRFVWKEGEHE